MKTIIRVFACALAFSIVSSCTSMSPLQLKRIKEPAKKLAVAVVDFQNKSGDPAFDKSTAKITGLMIDELLKTGKYKMVERERLNAVLGELKLNASGLVNPENAKRLGEQLGVDTLLFGNLTSVKYSRNKQTLFILWTEAQVTEAVLDARLVDVGTGSLLASSKSSASISQRQWIAFWFARLGKFAEKDSIVTDCIERACKQLANNLAAE